jgi:hypothetical protein
MTPDQETALMREFSKTPFCKELFMPYLDGRLNDIHNLVDTILCAGEPEKQFSRLASYSGRRREVRDLLDWMAQISNRNV